MKQKILSLLLAICLMVPTMVSAVEVESCKGNNLDQVKVGNDVVVCIYTYATGESGVESHHRFVKNKYSSTYNSLLVVNTVVPMGDDPAARENIPAYCVNENKHGVGDKGLSDPPSYAVTLKDWNSFVSAVGSDKATRVRNAILNAYPAKTAEELGFTANSYHENVYDAFTATKLAVFSILDYYGYTGKYGVITYYEPIAMVDDGTRGRKIVSKIEDIVKNSTTTPAMDKSVAFTEEETTIESDTITKKVTVNPPMGGTLTVNLTNAVSGTTIDGETTNSKTYTNAGYYGKPITVTVSVPKANITSQNLDIKINLAYKHLTYDLFYGIEPSGVYQSYIVPKPKYLTDQKSFNLTYSKDCEDTKKEYEACSACEKLDEEYKKCDQDGTCTQEFMEKYTACKDNLTCSEELKKEYDACFPPKGCEDTKKEYEACSECEQVVKEYEKCDKDGTCTQEIKDQYAACKDKAPCSEELKKEYDACFPPRTCEDVETEYKECRECEQIAKEYDVCKLDGTCTRDLIDKYEACGEKISCSDELIDEYNACNPTIEEPNPDTTDLNICLICLVITGMGVLAVTAYNKRKKMQQL